MKKMLYSLTLFLCLQFSCTGQTTKQMEDSNLKFYPFDGYYINLETLQRVEIDGILPTNFKSISDYSFRFYAPANWMNNFYNELVFQNSRFKIQNDCSIKITELSTSKSIVIDNPDKGCQVERVTGAHFLFASGNGVIEVKRLEGQYGYQVRNYSESGKCKYSLHIEHTFIEVKGNTNYHKPYLNYFTCTNKNLVFTSNNREFPKTVQVNLADGKLTEYPFTVNGIIRTDREENIPGFILIDEIRKKFKTIILNHSWTASPENLYDNNAETVLIGNVLYIAFYHGISTGSSLYAYDMNTGKQIWKANVKQLHAEHSEYYNKVYLSAYKDKIIMEGIEAQGKYLQIFESLSGKLVFSTIL
jgi:hypothetical protein